MPERFDRGAVLHNVVVDGADIHIAGLVAEHLEGGIAAQTADILAQLDAILAEHGSDRDHVLSALIFIVDMADKPAMNAEWQAFFAPEQLPTRATIGVADLGPDVRIEIVFRACRRP